MHKHIVNETEYNIRTFSRVGSPLDWEVRENDVYLGDARTKYLTNIVSVYAGPQSTKVCQFDSGDMTMIECELEIVEALAAYFE